MLIGFIATLLIILIFGPQLWSSHVLKRYNSPIDELPGTGGELATHLLKRFEIDDVKVDASEENTE